MTKPDLYLKPTFTALDAAQAIFRRRHKDALKLLDRAYEELLDAIDASVTQKVQKR